MKMALDPITKRFDYVYSELEMRLKKRDRRLLRRKRRERRLLRQQRRLRSISSDEMVNMKNQGYTLQEIGNTCGVTREAIRDRIKRHYSGKIEPNFISKKAVAKLLGFSNAEFDYYISQGIFCPICIGSRLLFNKIEILSLANDIQEDFSYSEVKKERFHLACINRWQNPEYKEKMISIFKLRWQNPEFIEKYRKGRDAKPNNSELLLQSILDKHYPNTYKYVGDFQTCIGGKFPDFININGKKEVIELFGTYWHNPDIFYWRPSQEELINHYKQYGFSCIVIWEEELKGETGDLLEHIKTGKIYMPSFISVKPLISLDPTTKRFSQV